MNRIKQVVAIYILISLLAASAYAKDTKTPSVREMFSKRIKQREKTKSIIMKTETTTKYQYPKSKGIIYKAGETRTDGFRVKGITYTWKKNVNGPTVKKEDSCYSSSLWDGFRKYEYACVNPSQLGHLLIDDRMSTKLIYTKRAGLGGVLNGYHRGDNERIEDLILNNPQGYKLRKKMELVRNNNCYVIDANVKGKGVYTLWLDPIHDYQMARLKVQRNAGDYIGENKLSPGDYSNESFEIISYQKVDGIWLPKKYMVSVDKVRTFNHLQNRRQDQLVENIKEVVLNPDHETLGSFLSDDIPYGTSTKFAALPPSMKFTWQDGKVIDADGNLIDPKTITDKTKSSGK